MRERNSKIVGISLPPEIYKKLNILMKTKYMTRSELIRDMIEVYTESISNVNKEIATTKENLELNENDLAKLLKAYYEIRTNQNAETIVVGLGIMTKGNKVLIGKRGKPDVHIKNLTWVFPGGKMTTLDFSQELVKIIKAETNLNVKVGKLIHARVHPDNLDKDFNIVALYFHCEVTDGKEKAGGLPNSNPLVKLQWVKPADVVKYFTTSTADEVMRFLVGLQASSSKN